MYPRTLVRLRARLVSALALLRWAAPLPAQLELRFSIPAAGSLSIVVRVVMPSFLFDYPRLDSKFGSLSP